MTIPAAAAPRTSAVFESRLSVGWIFAAFVLISAVFTWPLIRDLDTSAVPSDPGDPLLNTSILWWNATHVPFSAAWWNAPHYFPSWGVAAFTENLVGLAPLTSPIIWLTGNPVLAYNAAFFLSYPLAGVATYLLVFALCRRQDAAFLAGLSFAFTPYRAQEVSHLQMLASYGLPACLWAMHRYLDDGRQRWLWTFGVCWVLLSLTNGHYMLFGAILFAMWLAYFGSRRESRARAARVLAAWTAASVPLVPVLYEYQVVHTHYGLVRGMAEILWFSGRPHSWVEAHPNIRLWGSLFPAGKDNLFPGLTALTVVVVGGAWLLARAFAGAADGSARPADASARPAHATSSTAALLGSPATRIVLGVILGASVVLTAITLARGPWDAMIGPIPFKMTDLTRAIVLMVVCGGALAWTTPRLREALRRRDAIIFYAAAVIVIALFCCGPVLNAAERPILNPAPYTLLLALPGFSELRVAVRFWMVGVLCLSVAAGLVVAAIGPWRRPLQAVLMAVIGAGLLADGWLVDGTLAPTPEPLPPIEAGRTFPILELPIAVGAADWEATYHAAAHRRRTVNGVSGYNPPHYNALVTALQDRDVEALTALASFGELDVVVNTAADRDGAIAQFVAGAGGTRVTADSTRTLFHLAATPPPPEPGPPLPITAVAVADVPTLNASMKDPAATHDGRMETGWGAYPQVPGQWLVIDLGREQTVAAVTNAIGDFFIDYPRRIAVDLSLDGRDWDRVWEGPAAPLAFLGFVRAPRAAELRFTFAPRQARYVMLEQLDTAATMWRVSELTVHAPPPTARIK